MAEQEGPKTFADRLKYLFEVVRSPSGGRYSNNEVAAAVGVSGTYIGQLLNGSSDNPTKRTIERIADFFGVAPAYFFEDEVAASIHKRVEILLRLKEDDATNVAARLIGFSPQQLKVADSFLEQLQMVGGLRKGASRQAQPTQATTPEAEPPNPEADR
jgi:transcriptional regulator with XRE-family HTH domain